MFQDREDAGRRLAVLLQGRELRHPVVLAIPRGGVAVGVVLARELGADLDVVLARKLRAPGQPELAIGAVSETGQVCLNRDFEARAGPLRNYLVAEVDYQLAEIERRKRLFRAVRPPVPLEGRSVIVADDGLATGSTMIAALRVADAQQPHELVVAVPVACRERLEEVRTWCDETVCLITVDEFRAVGDFYEDFRPVEDEEVLRLLRGHAAAASAAGCS